MMIVSWYVCLTLKRNTEIEVEMFVAIIEMQADNENVRIVLSSFKARPEKLKMLEENGFFKEDFEMNIVEAEKWKKKIEKSEFEYRKNLYDFYSKTVKEVDELPSMRETKVSEYLLNRGCW